MHVSHGRSGQPSEQRTATFTGTVHLDPVLNAPGVMCGKRLREASPPTIRVSVPRSAAAAPPEIPASR